MERAMKMERITRLSFPLDKFTHKEIGSNFVAVVETLSLTRQSVRTALNRSSDGTKRTCFGAAAQH